MFVVGGRVSRLAYLEIEEAQAQRERMHLDNPRKVKLVCTEEWE